MEYAPRAQNTKLNRDIYNNNRKTGITDQVLLSIIVISLISNFPNTAMAENTESNTSVPSPTPSIAINQYSALIEAQSAYEQHPGSVTALHAYIRALRDARLAHSAFLLAQHSPSVTPELKRELLADYAAELTRLASSPARNQKERYAIADRALRLYEQLGSNSPTASNAPLFPRIRFDYIQALHARERMNDVIFEYENLIATGIVVPSYIQDEIADAYLYLEQPEIATALFQKVLSSQIETHPDNAELMQTHIGLYYALQEDGKWTEGQTVLEQSYLNEPQWRRLPGVAQRLPSESYLDIARTWAQAPSFYNDPGQAKERLETLSDNAPRDAGLKVALATVQKAQGQPREARATLKQAEALAPLSADLLVAQGQTALALQEWGQAKELAQYTMTHYPNHKGAKRLQEDWQTHQKPELQIGFNKTISSDSPVSGSGDHFTEALLYSPPISENWRALVATGFAQGSFDSNAVRQRWVRAGMQWRSRNLTLEADVSTQSYGYGQRTGARVSMMKNLNDAWTIGGSLAWRNPVTPLRALASNISSNTADLWGRWAPNDRREWSFSIAPSGYSDGNRRIELHINSKERLYQWPTVRIDGELNLSASKNTLNNTPYFNPRSDLTVLPGVRLSHLLYQRYEEQLEHYIHVHAGTYSQKDFGTGAIAAVGYGIRWRANRNLEIDATVTGVRRPYDGVQEKELRLALNINLRF